MLACVAWSRFLGEGEGREGEGDASDHLHQKRGVLSFSTITALAESERNGVIFLN